MKGSRGLDAESPRGYEHRVSVEAESETRLSAGLRIFRRVVFLSLLLCLGLTGCQHQPANYAVPPEDASRPNPFSATPDVIAAGKKAYDSADCGLCHGANGDGKGVLARDMKYNTRDWRKPDALKNFTDGDLFYILSRGKGAMPGYTDRDTPENLWRIVSYVRSLGEQ